MKQLLGTFQILISLVLIGLILLQQRGAGLSGVFGGAGEFYGTRRGLEKLIFWATVGAAGLFVAAAIASLLVS